MTNRIKKFLEASNCKSCGRAVEANLTHCQMCVSDGLENVHTAPEVPAWLQSEICLKWLRETVEGELDLCAHVILLAEYGHPWDLQTWTAREAVDIAKRVPGMDVGKAVASLAGDRQGGKR